MPTYDQLAHGYGKTWKVRLERNKQALDNPRRGDMWEEMLSEKALVVGVSQTKVAFAVLGPHPEDPENFLAWDYQHLHVMSRDGFRDWINSIENQSQANVHRMKRWIEDIPPKEKWGRICCYE